MTASVATELPRAKVLGRVRDSESGAELFRRLCEPKSFDRAGLAAAVASFPVPRSVGQDVVSGTWGVSGGSDSARGPWVTFTGVGDSRVATEGGMVRAEPGAVVGGAGLGFREGRTFRLAFGPGVAVCSSFDATRRERANDPDLLVKRRDAEVALVIVRPVLKPWRCDAGNPSTQITEWSKRSRSRMVKAFASVDWGGLRRCYCGQPMTALCHSFVATDRCDLSAAMPLAMVTLSYPGDWLAVAPSGKAAKRHLAMFRRRWFRALGWRLDGAWKLEFQKPRGWRLNDDRDYGLSTGEEAPHFHLLVPVPALVDGVDFKVWLSATWADVVGATGQERINHEAAGTNVEFGRTSRMSDPKRCAVYFLKHGSKTLDAKEYQHCVPAAWAAAGMGPGRFWGFWGMELATEVIDLDLEDWVVARRVLRHVARGRAASVAYSRALHAAEACGRPGWEVTKGVKRAKGDNLGSAGRRPRVRKLRTLGVGGQLSGGWVVVNDGPALARALGRAVNLRRSLAFGW